MKPQADVDSSAVLINSIVDDGVHVGANSVVTHCNLVKGFHVDEGSIINGVNTDDITVLIILSLILACLCVLFCSLFKLFIIIIGTKLCLLI